MAKRSSAPKLTKFPAPKPSGKVSRVQAKSFKGSPVIAPTALNKVSKSGGSTKSPRAFGGAPTIIARPTMPKARGNGSLT